MNYVEGQMMYLNALIMRKHASIISGAYKNRVVFHGFNKENQWTEEELLQDELRAMDKQIEWLSETMEHLAK